MKLLFVLVASGYKVTLEQNPINPGFFSLTLWCPSRFRQSCQIRRDILTEDVFCDALLSLKKSLDKYVKENING